MSYEELYNQAMEGKNNALETLKAQAGSGDAESQYVLSCVYDNMDSPFKDVDLGMYWLKKSADYKYEPALKKIKKMSSEAKKQYGISSNSETKKTNSGDIWSFEGRIDRATYLVYFFVYLLVFWIIFFLLGQFTSEPEAVHYGYYTSNPLVPNGFVEWAELFIRLVSLYLFLALFTKRLHDCGHSGWWALVPFCPIALFFMKGEDKENEYGPIVD